MAHIYRCNLLDSAQKIATVVMIECETDEEAKAEAACLFAEARKYQGIEVLDEAQRRVHAQIAPVVRPDPGKADPVRALGATVI